jgi:hypothetical protein
VSQVVTLHVWRVPGRRLPRALWRMARDRRRLRATPGVRFAKLVGTARRFGRPDPGRWAAVVGWTDAGAAERFEAAPVARSWRRLATGYCRLDLAPVASRGTWAGQNPFPGAVRPETGAVRPETGAVRPETGAGQPGPGAAAPDGGPVLALTRARLRATRALYFWRSFPPVAAAAGRAPGLLAAFGFGEAPIGWQGTVTLWRAGRDLVEFAYRHPAHRAAIAATPVRRWYAEELFARFAVLRIAGDRDVIECGPLSAEEDP